MVEGLTKSTAAKRKEMLRWLGERVSDFIRFTSPVSGFPCTRISVSNTGGT